MAESILRLDGAIGGLRVGVVKDGKVSLIPVTLGRDFGNEVEVIDGISGDEAVVINPPDS